MTGFARMVALVAVLLVWCGQAHARPLFFFEANLDGLQEVPPNASPGTGYVLLTVNTDTNFVTILEGTFQDLLVPANAAHIHAPAPPGVNAGIILPLTVTPATSGTISGSGTLSATNIQHILDGLAYVNVHTSLFPGGEIRGQLVLIPTPGALALMLAAGAIGPRRRRR